MLLSGIFDRDKPSLGEIIDDGKSGFLCKTRDPIDLANKIEKMIILSHESRVIMGNKGRLKVQKEYNEEIVLDYFVDVINKMS